MTISMRRLFAFIHRWTGLTFGLFAVVLAVTGAGLSLRPMLEPVIYRHMVTAPACAAPLPLDQLVASARKAHGKGKLSYVRIAPGEGGSTMVRFADNDDVFLDPCSGAILGQQNRWEGLFGRLEQLHKLTYWKDGFPNKLIKGVTALVLAFISVAGGLYLWWPRRRAAWKRAVVLDTRMPGRPFTLSLHQVTGLYTGLIVFVVAVTGAPLAFDWAKQMLYPLTASAPPPSKFESEPPPGKHPKPIPFETARQAMLKFTPDPESMVIHSPRKTEAMEVYAVARGTPHGEARNYLYLDAYSGRVLAFQPYRTLSAGRKLYYWMVAIHTGKAGGPVGDLILFVGMLGVVVMGYTGVESYLRKTVFAKATRPRRAGPILQTVSEDAP
ncbi:MAG: PepSY-associated TM helix domain-containing protein [Caulobacteraceae bacterium]